MLLPFRGGSKVSKSNDEREDGSCEGSLKYDVSFPLYSTKSGFGSSKSPAIPTFPRIEIRGGEIDDLTWVEQEI